MVMLEKRPQIGARSTAKAELRLDRTDISFHDSTKDKVRIEITLHNESAHRSTPTLMTIESAPFGAFVPWKPLAKIIVPAMEPGESRELRTEVARPRPLPLGDFSNL